MKRTHLPLNGMRVFDAAARHLSFTRAADELAVSPAAVGQQIRALEDDVQAFSDLGEFLDLPVRFYSSGMIVRLGFALATAIHPQVLLMDEWLLAGDASFMQRAQERLAGMVRGAEILVLSSHMPGVIENWCTRAVWMDQGRVRMDGTPGDVLAAYGAALAA